MTRLDEDEPEPYRPSGGMRPTGFSDLGLSGPAMSGYLDMEPDTGISGLAWMGVAAAVVVVAVLLWSWLSQL